MDSDVGATPVAQDNSNNNNKRFTLEEDQSLWRFLVENANGIQGTTWIRIWEDYRTTHQTTRTSKSLNARFSRFLVPKIHMIEFDNQTKADLCMRYRIAPSAELLQSLEEDHDITIDNEGLLVSCVVKPTMKRPSFESSGPLIPRKIIKTEAIEEEQELGFSSSHNPYALGDQELMQQEEEEQHLSHESEEGDDEETEEADDYSADRVLEKQPQQQHVPFVDHEIEHPMEQAYEQEQVMPAHGIIENDLPYAPFDFAPYLESMKKSIIEETHAVIRQTVGEIVQTQKAAEQEKLEEKASLKEFLGDLKTFVGGLKSSTMEGIEKRIDSALLSLVDHDKEIPMDNIRLILDLAVKMIGH